MPRIRPCEYCKGRRRKCERAFGDTTCVRCSRLNLDCILDTRPIDNSRYNTTSSSRDSTTESDTVAELDGNDELEDLCEYVKTLEEEMKQLQLNIDQQKQQNATTQQQQQQQQSLVQATTVSHMDTTLMPEEWKLTFVDGHLRLETGINTLSDLLRYRQLQIETAKPIRYLSPLNNTSIRFEMQEDTVMCKFAFYLTQHDFFNGSPDTPTDHYNTYSPWNHRHQNHIDHVPISSPLNDFTVLTSSPLLSASSYTTGMSPSCCDTTSSNGRFDKMLLSGTTSYCPELLVDLLLQQYFQCYNPVMPLIHQSTFITHYLKQTTTTDPTPSGMVDFYTTVNQQVRSSSSSSSTTSSSTSSEFTSQHSPITLAICCFMCLSYCKHLAFTSHQKREYGEYYYVACRERIDDLYDDPSPHRQLEALISINFVHKFTTMTLRLRDTRKLASLGFLISMELLKHAAQPDSLFTEVEKELISRHAIVASFAFSMTEFICAKRMDDIVPVKVNFKILPGESEMTVSMLELYTYMCDLVLHQDCIMMLQELRRAVIGEVGQVTLEALIRFEQKCLDWWTSLPKKWRHCEHPFAPSAKSAIESCEYEQALMAHSFVLILTLGVHTTLICPQNSQGQVSEMIQKRAVMMTLNCCELLIMLIDRMKTITRYCGFACEYFVHVYDALQVLWKHSQRTGSKKMIPMIVKYIDWMMDDLNNMVPVDNRLPSNMSPMSKSPLFHSSSPAPSSNGQASSYNGFGDGLDPSVYTKYPLPGHAILFDIINSTARNIGGTLY